MAKTVTIITRSGERRTFTVPENRSTVISSKGVKFKSTRVAKRDKSGRIVGERIAPAKVVGDPDIVDVRAEVFVPQGAIDPNVMARERQKDLPQRTVRKAPTVATARELREEARFQRALDIAESGQKEREALDLRAEGRREERIKKVKESQTLLQEKGLAPVGTPVLLLGQQALKNPFGQEFIADATLIPESTFDVVRRSRQVRKTEQQLEAEGLQEFTTSFGERQKIRLRGGGEAITEAVTSPYRFITTGSPEAFSEATLVFGGASIPAIAKTKASPKAKNVKLSDTTTIVEGSRGKSLSVGTPAKKGKGGVSDIKILEEATGLAIDPQTQTSQLFNIKAEARARAFTEGGKTTIVDPYKNLMPRNVELTVTDLRGNILQKKTGKFEGVSVEIAKGVTQGSVDIGFIEPIATRVVRDGKGGVKIDPIKTENIVSSGFVKKRGSGIVDFITASESKLFNIKTVGSAKQLKSDTSIQNAIRGFGGDFPFAVRKGQQVTVSSFENVLRRRRATDVKPLREAFNKKGQISVGLEQPSFNIGGSLIGEFGKGLKFRPKPPRRVGGRSSKFGTRFKGIRVIKPLDINKRGFGNKGLDKPLDINIPKSDSIRTPKIEEIIKTGQKPASITDTVRIPKPKQETITETIPRTPPAFRFDLIRTPPKTPRIPRIPIVPNFELSTKKKKRRKGTKSKVEQAFVPTGNLLGQLAGGRSIKIKTGKEAKILGIGLPRVRVK